MKKIYVVSEENHSDIAVTETFENAIKFLFEQDWFNGYTEYCGENYFYYSIYLVLGFDNVNDFNYETFMEKMKNKTEEDMIDFFEECRLYIQKRKIWEPSEN